MVGARILIVGAGLTSSLITHLLQRAAPNAFEVHVWDKARGVGGRMSVRRSSTGGQTDTGAQYVTEIAGVVGEHRALYDELVALGLIAPFTGTISGTRAADGDGQNWVAPAGLNAIVKGLLAASGARVVCGRSATALERVGASAGAPGSPPPQWRVAYAEPGLASPEFELFDAVILTMPVPQVLALADHLLQAEPTLLGEMRQVQYSSRYALSLFWAREDEVAREFFERLPWASLYPAPGLASDVVFLSHCAAKRGLAPGAEPPSLLVHSSVPFALKRMAAAADAGEVSRELLESVRRLLPGLPPPADQHLAPWKFSQVRHPLSRGKAAILVSDGAASPLILAGDAFSRHGSRFDGCYESADAACKLLLAQYLGIGGSGDSMDALARDAPTCAL